MIPVNGLYFYFTSIDDGCDEYVTTNYDNDGQDLDEMDNRNVDTISDEEPWYHTDDEYKNM